MDTIKILLVDDNLTDLASISGSIKRISNAVKKYLEVNITPLNFESAKNIDVNSYDILFVDIQNNDNSEFWGDNLLKFWIAHNGMGERFLKNVCLLTNFPMYRATYISSKPELSNIKLNKAKTSSAIELAEIIYDNFIQESWVNKTAIKECLKQMMSDLAKSKIEITSRDNDWNLPDKSLIYISSKGNILNRINHYYADGNTIIKKTEKSKEFNKSFKGASISKYYVELYYQARKNHSHETRRSKPDYKKNLTEVIGSFDDHPKLYFRFDGLVINFRYLQENGFSYKNHSEANIAFIMPSLPKGMKVKIENLNSEIITLLNMLIKKCREVFA